MVVFSIFKQTDDIGPNRWHQASEMNMPGPSWTILFHKYLVVSEDTGFVEITLSIPQDNSIQNRIEKPVPMPGCSILRSGYFETFVKREQRILQNLLGCLLFRLVFVCFLFSGVIYSKMANVDFRTYCNTFWNIFGSTKMVTELGPSDPIFINKMFQNI